MKYLNRLLIFLFLFCAITGYSENEKQAITIQYPDNLDMEVMSLMLKPLTAEELEVEADAWLHRLRFRQQEISSGEIAVRGTSDTILQQYQARIQNEDTTPTVSVKSDAPTTVSLTKEERLQILTKLRADKTAVIDRLKLVLEQWEKKGGDAEMHYKYIEAVAGIEVDVTDASALWITLSGWAISPEGGLRWALNIIEFIVMLVLAIFLSRVAGRIVRELLKKSTKVSDLMKSFIEKSTRRVVIILGLIIGLAALEINIGPIIALIGAAGFVVGFALQGTLSNFASGLLIMFYEPFDVGEVVEVAGVSGKVDSMNIVSTTIKTFDNQVLVIPNNSVWNDVIRNKTKSHERRVDLVFGIGYESKIDEAMSILKEVVGSHDKILETPEPTIKVNELADSSVNLICRPWVKTPDYWDVHWDLMQTVKQRFDEAGISIPYPQTDVHFHWDKNLNPMNKLEADNSETDKKRSENQSSEKQKPKEPINDELDGDQNDDGDNQG